ncbi:hypothetical protein JCM11641_004845 [Rhodosporidiobolus odoratus]
MASLLNRALAGASEDATTKGGRRQSGGGARSSPYARPADKWNHDKFADNDAGPASRSPNAPQGRGSLAARLGPGGSSDSGRKTNKLVIRNLHYEVSERELELLFVQIGPITSGPKIKFDRSGRSEGVAWITYGSEEHATQAKEAFNGAPAKGQAIEVDYDFRPDRIAGPGGASAPGTLLARLNADPTRGPKFATPTGPSGGRAPRGRGERTVSGNGGAPRGGAGGRGAAGGGRGGRGEARQKREPKTNDDLDKELEAFMKAPEGSAKPTEIASPAAAPQAESGGDVEMS